MEYNNDAAMVDKIVTQLVTDLELVKVHWQKEDVLWGSLHKLAAMVRSQNVVVNNAVDVVRKASIGDQNFIACLRGDDPNTTALRHAIVDLADALKELYSC